MVNKASRDEGKTSKFWVARNQDHMHRHIQNKVGHFPLAQNTLCYQLAMLAKISIVKSIPLISFDSPSLFGEFLILGVRMGTESVAHSMR